MLRRLEELDRVDREKGLGALPFGTDVVGPAPHRSKGRARRTHGPVLPGLLISGVIAGIVMLHDPGMTGYRFRQLVDNLRGSDAGAYAFVATSTSGDPVGWSHCQPIHYVVNPEGAPDGWETTIEAGVDAISEASGFEFDFEGTTGDRSFSDRRQDAGGPPPRS